jgi:hypothetical protein
MYYITNEEINSIFERLENIAIEDEKTNTLKIDDLSYQQIFKKLNSILHNKKLTHYTLLE